MAIQTKTSRDAASAAAAAAELAATDGKHDKFSEKSTPHNSHINHTISGPLAYFIGSLHGTD